MWAAQHLWGVCTQVDEHSFAALRNLALLRTQLHGLQSQLRNLNYANACEQVRVCRQ